MAGSRFAYVKSYELLDSVLPNTFMVVRLDGRAFHRFSDVHKFEKPNDLRALELMDKSAQSVMEEYSDISMAFGESDEYSFLLPRDCKLYNRRQSKILTSLTSMFTSSYVFNWSKYFPTTPLQYPPVFDGRLVVYPSEKEVRDYFAWRQADAHINNLYNTTFWSLVQQGGLSNTKAHERLKGTMSGQKNEILFSQFGINYSKLPARYRKGSVLVKEELEVPLAPNLELTLNEEASPPSALEKPLNKTERKKARKREREEVAQRKKDARVQILHCDVIEDGFWQERPELLK